MDLRDRTDQNRPVPPMPSRETTATVLGACGIAIPALLAAGGAAARPGGVWQGVPGWAPAAGILAAAVVLALAAHRRGSLAACAGLLLPVGLLLAGAPLAGVRALSGPPLVALALAGVAIAVAGSGLRPPRVLFLPLAFAVLVAAAGRTHARVGPEGDEPHYLMVAESLLRDGDLSLERDYAEGRYTVFHDAPLAPHFRVRGKGGAIYSLHAVGLSVLILPAWALAGLRGRHRLHGAPGGARRARGARVGARADRPRRAGRCGRLGVRAVPAPRPLRRPRVHGGAGGARPVVRSPARAAAGPRARRRRGRRPRGGRPAVAQRPLRAARRPGGRARPVAAPARARRSRGPRAGRRVRGRAAGLPPGALRLLGPAARLRAPPGARALDTRRGPSRTAARPGVRPARRTPPFSRSRCRASRFSGGAIDDWRSWRARPSASCS